MDILRKEENKKYYFENEFGRLYTVQIEREYDDGRVLLNFLDSYTPYKGPFYCSKSELLEYIVELHDEV